MRSLEAIMRARLAVGPAPTVQRGGIVAPVGIREARARQLETVGHLRRLLTRPEGNAKVGKGHPTVSLALAPATGSGIANTCPAAVPSCIAACLGHSAGRMVMPAAGDAREWRTVLAATDPVAFLSIIAHEVGTAVGQHRRIGLRLNIASDVRWERVAPWILTMRGVAAYDYTKWPLHLRDGLDGSYRLTLSHAGAVNREACLSALDAGGNVAVVFATRRGEPLPPSWHGHRVIDGDLTDFRPGDPEGVVVGLRAKGGAIGAPIGTDEFVQPA